MNKELLAEIGQACIDWYEDTGECHFCQTDKNGNHDADAECPVELYLQKKGIKSDGSIG